jgi:hypothetical protein
MKRRAGAWDSRRALVMMAVLGLASCESVDKRSDDAAAAAETECPERVSSDLHLSASAVDRVIPSALELHDNSGHRQLARRVMISVSPKSAASGLEILSSTVQLTPLGGVFTGWAEIAEPTQSTTRAVDVIPGRVRVAPFFSSSTLRPQTLYLDLMIQPGSVPVDELSITTTGLWDAQGRPVSADEVHIQLNPARHFTMFDVLESDVSLEVLVAQARGAKQTWRCSVSTQIELLDRDSVLPDLWTLHRVGRDGAPDEWLTLNDPTSGPFRPIFASPEAARGFMRWLGATTTNRVGPYSVGLFALQKPDYRNIPDINREVTVPFHSIAAPDFPNLEVKRVGEP